MRGSSSLTKVTLLAVVMVLLTIGMIPQPSQADGAVAISGSFYRQKFQIPVGGSASGPGINVTAYNQGSESATFMVTSATPPDVTIELSDNQFVLAPSESRQVLVAVHVGADAIPNIHEITVTVTAQKPGVEGEVVVLGAASQSASLSIVGEAGHVHVETVSPRGDRAVTQIILRKAIDGEEYDFGYSNTGLLDMVVSPGAYVVRSYSMSELLAEEEFTVANLEQKNITMQVETVFFSYFSVTETDDETGRISYARLLYTIKNVYQAMADAQVNLVVTIDGADLETVSGILTLSVLNTGDTGVPYSYVPSTGWGKGTYGFSLELYVGGQLYAKTTETSLDVSPPKHSMLWLWILLGVLAGAGLGFLIFFLLKRRQKGEKPEKAEKKRKEEKPARKAEEPLPKPEPYRPAEHVRPVEPVRYQEPTVEPAAEPATLSTVSTLKARMASMGRDQGTGKPAEEEPDTEKKDEPVETGPLASQPVPVPPPPKIEPERPAVKKVEEKGHKPPASEKPAGHKPGIFSKVTATGKKEPPKPPVAQGPAPVKPGDEITINWPPKTVEPPKPPSDVQINWPPKPVEPPKPSALEEAARQRVEAQKNVVAPEEAAPDEEAATEEPGEPGEPGEPQIPPSRSSFSEAARLRMEARLRASEKGKTGAGPGESQTDGGSGEGGDHSPSP